MLIRSSECDKLILPFTTYFNKCMHRHSVILPWHTKRRPIPHLVSDDAPRRAERRLRLLLRVLLVSGRLLLLLLLLLRLLGLAGRRLLRRVGDCRRRIGRGRGGRRCLATSSGRPRTARRRLDGTQTGGGEGS